MLDDNTLPDEPVMLNTLLSKVAYFPPLPNTRQLEPVPPFSI